MHRLLLSRVLCNSSCSVNGGGARALPQVWESTLKLLWVTTRSSVQFYSSKTDCSSCREPPPQQSKDSNNDPSKRTSEFSSVANCKEMAMDSVAGCSGEGKSKRTRDFLSPPRPTGSKKKVKGANKNDSNARTAEPELICLDDIHIPLKSTARIKKKKQPSLDFIPLPPSPPPPLPPPLPSPPPPPSHSEMDEVLSDFFVLDKNASGMLFPIPLPPHFMDIEDKPSKHVKKTSPGVVAHASKSISSDTDEISVVYNSDATLPEKFRNINLNKSKSGAQAERISNGADQIDIVFEGSWPWVFKSPEATSRKQHPLLGRKHMGSDQIRNCHQSTKHGYKTIEKTPEPEIVGSSLSTSEPEIIALETRGKSLLGRVSPENFISFNTGKNAQYEKEEKEIITLDSQYTPGQRRKKKAQKNKKQQPLDKELDVTERAGCISLSLESSPDILKVGVIDPDVVEIDNSFPSGSNCVDMENSVDMEDSVDMEIVDVYDSDHERLSVDQERLSDDHERLSVDQERLSVSSVQSVGVIDVHESDNESVSSHSNHGGQGVDISTDEFIALQRARIEELENTEIDLDNEVLQKREQLEKYRNWITTGLGEEVLVHNKVKKNDTLFTLMSYNVLAQQLLLDNQFLYGECEYKHLEWKYRWALLQYEVEDISPDVLLLQEVQASHYYSYFLPWLNLKGYEGVYKKRTGDKCDGCAIFYKTNKFSMIEHVTVEYNQPKAARVLDRDNIGIIAKLAPVGKPQSPVCVATTHFLYNPKRHDVKLAQAVLLLTELDRICYEGEENGVTQYCPIIVTGDFNSEPHTALLDLLKEGRIHYEGLSSRSLTQHGTYPVLGAELIPSSLGITDRCQHSVLAQSRYVEKTTGQLFSLSDKRKIEDSLIRFNNTDRSHTLKGVKAGSSGPQPTGWFSHGFNLHSVYRHYTKRAVEATTFHNKWTSVDYILYSRIYSQQRGQSVEGKLKLLGRYSLLCSNEAWRFAPLPSAVCPSDHFPLAAQFLLRDK